MYHRADFIQSDPVQFPHRYTLKQDIEVSGLLTAIMSFGNRKQILKKADELHGLMGIRLISMYCPFSGREISHRGQPVVLSDAVTC